MPIDVNVTGTPGRCQGYDWTRETLVIEEFACNMKLILLLPNDHDQNHI